MYIYDDLAKRADRPVQVGLIGAGKFGSMFLSQVPTTVGLEVKAIADLDPDRARQACRNVGWSEELIKKTEFFDSTQAMIDAGLAADLDGLLQLRLELQRGYPTEDTNVLAARAYGHPPDSPIVAAARKRGSAASSSVRLI